MNVHLRGNDIHISNHLLDVAERRSERLDRYFRGPADAKIELRHAHRKTGKDRVVAQCTVQIGHTILRAEEADPDAERAVELVLEKMERQARRFHERRADRSHPKIEPGDVVAGELEAEDDEETRVIRRKRFSVKPMDEAEAIDQMLLLGHDFFLFDNIDEGRVSLIYRRRDGGIGMLVPEPL